MSLDEAGVCLDDAAGVTIAERLGCAEALEFRLETFADVLNLLRDLSAALS